MNASCFNELFSLVNSNPGDLCIHPEPLTHRWGPRWPRGLDAVYHVVNSLIGVCTCYMVNIKTSKGIFNSIPNTTIINLNDVFQQSVSRLFCYKVYHWLGCLHARKLVMHCQDFGPK